MRRSGAGQSGNCRASGDQDTGPVHKGHHSQSCQNRGDANVANDNAIRQTDEERHAEARENASDNRGPLAPRGLDSMDNQRGDDPGDVGGSDDGEVDAPVQHDRHHTQSEEADLGQLEGHRSKISGVKNRSGFRTDIKTTTAKSIPTSAKSSRFCWRNLGIGKFSGSSDRPPFPDGEDLLLILADGDSHEEGQADGHSVPIRRDPHHG